MFDHEPERAAELAARLDRARRDVTGAARLLFETQSVVARFEETGVITAALCNDLGLVGPPARAAGVERDVRHDYPSGIYRFAHIPVSTVETGDVFARAFVRWLEIQRSIAFIDELLRHLPPGPVRTALPPLIPERFTVALVEGWRGEVCHVAQTDANGRLAAYKIVDPSFHNWFGLAMALRRQEIADFPLCNKSFNLSYCGHDL
jgi:Ni,Fe-hydrogenase III large subunit